MTELALAEQLRDEIAPIVQRAQSMIVSTVEQRHEAMDFLKLDKAAQDRVKAFFEKRKKKAHELWKLECDEEAGFLNPLKGAETIVKQKVLVWDEEDKRLRLEEQRRLQAIADEEARKERERLEKQAAKLKTPEKREAKLEQAAAVIAPVVTIQEPEKQKGESTRTRWKAKLTDKYALIQAAAQGSEIAAACLTFDQSAADRLATAMKGLVTVPGMEWYTDTVLAVSSRA